MVLSLYVSSLCHKVAHFLFFNEAILDKHWKEDVGLSGLALQCNSSNCLVLIMHRQCGETICSVMGNGVTQQHYISARLLYRSMFGTYQQDEYSLRLRTVHCIESLCSSVVVMHVEKYCLAGRDTPAKAPASSMDTSEMPATKAANITAPQRVSRDTCAFAIPKTLLTQ